MSCIFYFLDVEMLLNFVDIERKKNILCQCIVTELFLHRCLPFTIWKVLLFSLQSESRKFHNCCQNEPGSVAQ